MKWHETCWLTSACVMQLTLNYTMIQKSKSKQKHTWITHARKTVKTRRNLWRCKQTCNWNCGFTVISWIQCENKRKLVLLVSGQQLCSLGGHFKEVTVFSWSLKFDSKSLKVCLSFFLIPLYQTLIVYLSIYLSVCLSVCLSVSLFLSSTLVPDPDCLSIYHPSVYLSVCLSSICLSICLSVCLCLSFFLSF